MDNLEKDIERVREIRKVVNYCLDTMSERTDIDIALCSVLDLMKGYNDPRDEFGGF